LSKAWAEIFVVCICCHSRVLLFARTKIIIERKAPNLFWGGDNFSFFQLITAIGVYLNMLNTFLLAAGVIFVFMCIMFVVALITKNNSVADIGWGAGFALVAVTLFFFNQNQSLGLIIITAITLVWGLRLSIYLFIRNAGKPEDWRYANWRKEWGNYVVIRSFMQVFMLQGAIMYLNVLPVIVANASQNIGAYALPFFAVGFGLWLIGFLFETIADWQMYRFKNDAANKGKVMNTGVWRYSRHPNYFGEQLWWWALGGFAVSLGQPEMLVGTAFNSLVLATVTVMTENKMLTRWAPERAELYRQYIRTTSPLIPWFKRGSRKVA
jgi:steroid 5-alpha reductase family enzyme